VGTAPRPETSSFARWEPRRAPKLPPLRGGSCAREEASDRRVRMPPRCFSKSEGRAFSRGDFL